MREPRFSDAPCYGIEFDAKSKVCRVCLANASCQRKLLSRLGASKREPGLLVRPTSPLKKQLPNARPDALKRILTSRVVRQPAFNPALAKSQYQ